MLESEVKFVISAPLWHCNNSFEWAKQHDFEAGLFVCLANGWKRESLKESFYYIIDQNKWITILKYCKIWFAISMRNQMNRNTPEINQKSNARDQPNWKSTSRKDEIGNCKGIEQRGRHVAACLSWCLGLSCILRAFGKRRVSCGGGPVSQRKQCLQSS